MSSARGLGGLLLIALAGGMAVAVPVRAAGPRATPEPGATSVPAAPDPHLLGGWLATTEVEGKARGHWLALHGDGTWQRIEDYFGFRAENRGRWLPDGDGVVLENLDVRLYLSEGKLRLVSGGEMLYTFEPCAAMPKTLAELPPFPRTLSETVAILSAELPERERLVIAGTLAQDLGRFHHGLGTYVRNRFGLWGPNPALLAACKVDHPDDASAVILRALRDHLRHTRPGGRDLEALEGVLRDLAIGAFPVRQMTLERFVSTLNQETRRGLRRKGLLEDAVVFELAPPKDDEERRQRQAVWLNFPPGLHAWGEVDRPGEGTPVVELVAAFHKWMKAPGRVVLQPELGSPWYQTPQESPDFASVRWRDDWFEIATATEREGGSAIRVDTWSMLGQAPPMPVEQAFSYAGTARERFLPARHPIEVVIAGSPLPGQGDVWRWSYQVRSTVDGQLPEADGEVVGAPLGRIRWVDVRKAPRLSAAQALSRFRDALAAGPPAPVPDRVQIRLRRASGPGAWYYEVVVAGETDAAAGLVMLDGRVIRR